MNDFYFILFGLFLALLAERIEQVLSHRLSKHKSVVFSHLTSKGGRLVWR